MILPDVRGLATKVYLCICILEQVKHPFSSNPDTCREPQPQPQPCAGNRGRGEQVAWRRKKRRGRWRARNGHRKLPPIRASVRSTMAVSCTSSASFPPSQVHALSSPFQFCVLVVWLIGSKLIDKDLTFLPRLKPEVLFSLILFLISCKWLRLEESRVSACNRWN